MHARTKTATQHLGKGKLLKAIVLLLLVAFVANCASNQSSSQEAANANAIGTSNSSLNGIRLTAVSEFLEYSTKSTDPLTLIKCSDANATVTTKDSINLSEVGTQKVAYTISKDGQSAEKTLSFTVRDTKGPDIKLNATELQTELGQEVDLLGNITSVEDPVDGPLAYTETAPESSAKNIGKEVFYNAGWYTTEGSVDYSTPATYKIGVVAADRHGSKTTKSFSVVVKEPEPEIAESETPEAVIPAAVEETPAPDVHSYVINTNTGKFHIPSCSSVRQMKDKNRWDVEMTRDAVIGMGYVPCQRCNP